MFYVTLLAETSGDTLPADCRHYESSPCHPTPLPLVSQSETKFLHIPEMQQSFIHVTMIHILILKCEQQEYAHNFCECLEMEHIR